MQQLLGSVGASLILFALTRGQFFWGSAFLSSNFSSGAFTLILVGLLFLVIAKFKLTPVATILSGLVIWFVSDITNAQYTLINGNDCISIVAILFGILVIYKDWGQKLYYILFGFSFLLAYELLRVSGGELLISDDHSANIYRLSLLSNHFPWIPFYNPMWNGGEEARDFFATGILNIYLIFAPILAIFTTEQVYNYIVCTILFVILPASVYYGSLLWNSPEELDNGLEQNTDKVDKNCAIISAILAMTSSLVWYRWGLKYGSMGFVTTSALIPLASGLIFKTIKQHKATSIPILALTILISSLVLFWTLGGLALGLVVLFSVLSYPEALKAKKLYLTAILFIALNLVWLIPFFAASKVFDFVSIEETTIATATDSEPIKMHDDGVVINKKVKAKTHTFDLKGVVKGARDFFVTVNPLIIFLFAFGITRRNRPLAFTIAGLFGIGLLISPLKPQLELDRMLVVGTILATMISGRVWREFDTSILKRGIFGALLFSGFFFTAQIVGDRSVEKYFYSDKDFHKMVEVLKENTGTGRAFFTGFVLHELSGGHLAPLQHLTGLPLVASAPTHSLWWYTDAVPEDFRNRGYKGNEEFFEYFNVSLVFAHENNWRAYFRSHREIYQEIGNAGRFITFKRKRKSESYVLQGEVNDLVQNEAKLSFTPINTSLILKYRYLPILKSTNCKISPYKLCKEVSLIKLDECRVGENTRIDTNPILARIWEK